MPWDRFGGLPHTYVLVPPPLVVGMGGPMPLRDWLVHGHPERNNVWADVVSEFYDRAARDPEIASYFAGVDMASLQKHFLSTLMLVTGNGLSVGAVRQIQARHAEVRNSRGFPITPEVYDAAIGVLVDILAAKDVPPETCREVERVLAPLRDAIVVGMSDGRQG